MMFEDLHVTLSPRLSAVRNLSRMVEEFGNANQTNKAIRLVTR